MLIIGELTMLAAQVLCPSLLFLLFAILFSLLFPSPVSSPGLCLNVIQLRDLPGLPYIKSMPLCYSSSQYTPIFILWHFIFIGYYTIFFTGLLPTSSAGAILRAGILSAFIILEYIVSSPELSWCSRNIC